MRTAICLLPFPWQLAIADDAFMNAARDVAGEAQAAGKELVVFYQLDNEAVTFDLSNAVIFKTSFRRGRAAGQTSSRSRVGGSPFREVLLWSCHNTIGVFQTDRRLLRYTPPNGITIGTRFVKKKLPSVLREMRESPSYPGISSGNGDTRAGN